MMSSIKNYQKQGGAGYPVLPDIRPDIEIIWPYIWQFNLLYLTTENLFKQTDKCIIFLNS